MNIDSSSAILPVPCRYYRVYTDLGIPCREEKFGFVERELPLPAAQTAVILVDVWSTHYIDSHLERVKEVVEQRLVPLLDAARGAGLLIVHAPSSDVVELREESELPAPAELQQVTHTNWPPTEFRSLYRTDDYSAFGRENEPLLDEARARYKTELRIAPAASPLPGEPLVRSGQELHEILAERHILHLVYAGFATNWCVLLRDYGVLEMSGRGYNVILVRDATVGIEFHDTVAKGTATEMAIREMETKHAWSTTTADFVAACGKVWRILRDNGEWP